ncbi:MAG: hypothetical protein WBY73_04405, partial [Candidatus Acidiferrales bacterium]
AMQTAAKENQQRRRNEAASRGHGMDGRTLLLKRGGLETKKTSKRRRSVFFLATFIELIRSYRQNSCVNHLSRQR